MTYQIEPFDYNSKFILNKSQHFTIRRKKIFNQFFLNPKSKQMQKISIS